MADLLQAPGDAEGVRGGLQHGERVGGNLSRVGVLERVEGGCQPLEHRGLRPVLPAGDAQLDLAAVRIHAHEGRGLERRIRSGGRYGLRFAVHVVYDLKALSHVGADGSA